MFCPRMRRVLFSFACWLITWMRKRKVVPFFGNLIFPSCFAPLLRQLLQPPEHCLEPEGVDGYSPNRDRGSTSVCASGRPEIFTPLLGSPFRALLTCPTFFFFDLACVGKEMLQPFLLMAQRMSRLFLLLRATLSICSAVKCPRKSSNNSFIEKPNCVLL